jgi:hypothetical protein
MLQAAGPVGLGRNVSDLRAKRTDHGNMIDDDFASDDVDLEQAERREFMRRLREQNLRALTRNRESLLVHTLQLPVTDPIQEWRAWHDQRDAERAAETERRRQRESDEAEIAEALAIATDTIERLEQHVDKLEARITELEGRRDRRDRRGRRKPEKRAESEVVDLPQFLQPRFAGGLRFTQPTITKRP